jgi:hypothetical protein
MPLLSVSQLMRPVPLLSALLVFWVARSYQITTRLSHPTASPAVSHQLRASSPSNATSPAQTQAQSESKRVDRRELVQQCLRIAETDVLAAMDFAVAQKLTGDDPGLLTALVLRWAERDFAGALAWTQAQPPGPARDNTLAHLAFLRAQSDPHAAARIVSQIPAGPIHEEAVISVVHQWSRHDWEAARFWIDGLTPENLRLRALSELTISTDRAPVL